jgi:hypothetical protein
VTQAALTVSDQVVGWLKTTFADWINSHQSTSSQDAVPNRGDAISVPLLAANQTRVGPRKPIGCAYKLSFASTDLFYMSTTCHK